VVAECRWKAGELEPVWREPFGMMASATEQQPVQGLVEDSDPV
jgi:hypothetical protein